MDYYLSFVQHVRCLPVRFRFRSVTGEWRHCHPTLKIHFKYGNCPFRTETVNSETDRIPSSIVYPLIKDAELYNNSGLELESQEEFRGTDNS